MTYLVDTNIVSEFKKREPSARVVQWLSARPASSLYLSVLTLGEIRKGVESDLDPARRARLVDWLQHDLPNFFAARILPIDAGVADRWGRLVATAGRPLPAIDSLLAATALAHGLTFVTRNTKHVSGLGVETFSPWDD